MANDPRLARCGFAKLVGSDLDYILRKYECSMGRRSKAGQQDVVLGDVMSISRCAQGGPERRLWAGGAAQTCWLHRAQARRHPLHLPRWPPCRSGCAPAPAHPYRQHCDIKYNFTKSECGVLRGAVSG